VNPAKSIAAAGMATFLLSLAAVVASPLVAQAGWTRVKGCGTPVAGAAVGQDAVCQPYVPARYLAATPLKQDMPLDCESAALAVALQIKGIALSQNWVFAQLPKDPRIALVSRDRPVTWGDPYAAFVGNVDGSETSYTGYGVYYPPIAAVAESAGAAAVGHSGWTTAQIEAEVGAGNPVVVWVNFNFGYSRTSTWDARDGRAIPYTTEEHAVTVIGFSTIAGTVTVMDVGVGHTRALSTAAFTAAIATFGGMAVAIS
jgi:uncharacterized protein YvpB